MKRILGIVGSPRKGGNTEVLVGRMLSAARAAGAATDLVRLRDKTIHECQGCHACWKGRPCVRHDDMNGLYGQLAESDVLVLGTPVYWYGPTALMKAFIDRLAYFNCPDNRPKIAGKAVALAVPYEETDPATAAGVVEFFEKCCKYLQVRLVGRVIAPGVSEIGDILKHPDRLHEAEALGRRLAGE